MPLPARQAVACGLGLIVAAIALAAPAVALAADEEIQVYMDDMSKQGHFGLDVHNNYVLDGSDKPDYPGGLISRDTYRLTPEFAYGITDNLEAGLYLLTAVDPNGGINFGGPKVRLKYIAPKASPDQDYFWGVNFEIGRLNRHFDNNPSGAELKTIYGIRKGPWTVVFNGNIDWTVSGPDPQPVSFDFDTKVSYKVADNLDVGFESYNGLGDVKALGNFSRNTQMLYGVIDTSIAGWDLNLGVGRGLTGVSDQWVAKAIIGVPFP